jgi:hypothetical protein
MVAAVAEVGQSVVVSEYRLEDRGWIFGREKGFFI